MHRNSKPPGIAPARLLAFDILLAVETRGAFASELLHSEKTATLSLPDRRLATAIAMGVLRWRGQLDFFIERTSRRKPAQLDPEVLTALRMGIYQRRFLTRVPARAVVQDSVELVKYARRHSAAGFVNAVLRRSPLDPIETLLATEADPSVRAEVVLSHPHWLLARWDGRFGSETAKRICEYDNSVPVTAIHVDTRQLSSDAAAAHLRAAGLEVEPGALVRDALRITAGDVTKTDLWREGAVWVQDEASQLVPLLLQPSSDDLVLDCCAAPGGKSALIVSVWPQTTVLAMDAHAHRIRLLRRLRGEARVLAVAADAAKPLPLARQFRRILVDAPCSGTGTLARNPEIRWRLRPQDVRELADRQFKIVVNALSALASGGRLVYSVCSLEPEESEEVVWRVLQSHTDCRLLPARDVLMRGQKQGWLVAEPAVLTADEFLNTVPGVQQADGFFAAVIEKTSGA